MPLPDDIHSLRVRPLNDHPIAKNGKHVLYWLQMTHRLEYNFALRYAIEQANELGLPLRVYHGLNENYPHASRRIDAFILQGVKELLHSFAAHSIPYGFYYAKGRVKSILPQLIREAALVVSDDFPAFLAPHFNAKMAQVAKCKYVVVDSHTTIPMRCFDHEEFAAYTIRPKIQRLLSQALIPFQLPRLENKKPMKWPDYFLKKNFNLEKELASRKINQKIAPVHWKGGEKPAQEQAEKFIAERLSNYERDRNAPEKDATSHLSPYLHFGMISPIDVARRVQKKRSIFSESFLEELIVRRDLAYNFCFHNPNYMRFEGLNDWSRQTLNAHRKDLRPYTYSLAQLEKAETHDPYWNAAQREMVLTGKMHGYMRMYWAKKILEWTPSPEKAFEYAIALNDTYELDGRDPNGYTGIAWAIGGKHDRAWNERPIFGKIRYMNDKGLERKFDMEPYLHRFASFPKNGFN